MRRRPSVLLCVALVLLAAIGAESLGWLVVSRQVQGEFDAWIAARRAQGWTITHGTEQLGGWPFAAAVKIASFSISGGKALVPGGLAWRSARLVLEVDLSSPGRLLVLPIGQQRIAAFGTPPIAVAAKRIEATTRFASLLLFPGSEAPDTLAIRAAGVRVGLSNLDPRVLSAQTLAIRGVLNGSAADGTRLEASVKLEATGIGIADERLQGLGPDIRIFSLNGALIGRVPMGTTWPARLSAWRDSGGMVALRSLSLVWGPLAVGGSARLALDGGLQPSGQGTARIVGYAATLDALAAAGKIGDGAATAAKAILMLLAEPSRAGHPPEVDIPFHLENRTLSVGRIPLLKLPPMTWPSGT